MLFAVALVAAAFLAIAGAFGTWEEPLRERLGFWVVGVAGAGLVGFGLDRQLVRIAWLCDKAGMRALLIVLLIVPPAGLAASSAAAIMLHSPINWPLYWRILPQMLLVGMGLLALFLVATPRRAPASEPQVPLGPTLGGLLPLKFSGAQLFAIEAQDHYVRVHTDRGTGLVSMTFDRALVSVARLSGRQVHRSWWVARSAVTGVRRGDGRATLTLQGGAIAPVSRRYARELRSAGWY
ncbi:MAG TPA: LytTR family DNA-binding domain-containing protein [Steroidobacteraceae bacterium]|nr:LytTR family DNA-binding domain-containing protein [Steroidobacteraceae bacterium]